MSQEGDLSVKSLIKKAGAEQEIQYGTEKDRLRINLRNDDIELWRQHHTSNPGRTTLLLACEDSKGNISETKLTWVVGAAIRSEITKTKEEAKEILRSVGIAEKLIDLVTQHCPGLGNSVVWAFHLERHGWLTATPVKTWE